MGASEVLSSMGLVHAYHILEAASKLRYRNFELLQAAVSRLVLPTAGDVSLGSDAGQRADAGAPGAPPGSAKHLSARQRRQLSAGGSGDADMALDSGLAERPGGRSPAPAHLWEEVATHARKNLAGTQTATLTSADHHMGTDPKFPETPALRAETLPS